MICSVRKEAFCQLKAEDLHEFFSFFSSTSLHEWLNMGHINLSHYRFLEGITCSPADVDLR